LKLADLHPGEKAVIVKVSGHGGFRKRILEMGFVRGKVVEALQSAPLLDPVKYLVMGYEVSLRRSEAANIEVVGMSLLADIDKKEIPEDLIEEEALRRVALSRGKHIRVALVGNPNCGKTALFNRVSGGHEHEGNYSGVTVDAKEGSFSFEGYTISLVDLPGTYSLSAYSPEERYVRQHLIDEVPDVVINVVDASNLERNLFLTTQLIDINVRMVMALNMYDEFQQRGDSLNVSQLGQLLGTPIVPTIARKGWGLNNLFHTVIKVYEDADDVVLTRHIHVNHGHELEHCITHVRKAIAVNESVKARYSCRFLAIKLLEGDAEVERIVAALPNAEAIFATRDKSVGIIKQELKEDPEAAITNAKYGYIAGALKETYVRRKSEKPRRSRKIDALVLNKYLGYPIFLLFMFVMFEATFALGAFPMSWIETGVAALSDLVSQQMTPGPFKDLLVDGIIGGVGGVIVFLPNILILFFFISLMEDTGYMARAAFIMDKLMHKMGLHGKSFIPLIMGFGCSVPAIMAARTIESRNSRLLTILVTPLMSCSAKSPVYLLLAGAFFPNHAGIVLFGLYLMGIVMAVVLARVFKRFFFKKEDLPFVMELPPFRVPTTRSVLRHMWEKGYQYLQKMGTVILLASVVIWLLGYFPRNAAYESNPTPENHRLQQEQSFIGHLGRVVEPVIKPLGFDWKIGVSLLSGVAAKEIVVSTLSVLYTAEGDETALPERLKADTYADGRAVFNPAVALALMVFVLLYFPCIATITAIKHETGTWRWSLFEVVYTVAVAWVMAFLTYRVALLFL
jgi:ferrous iron transport protein B